jgi:hypothetical protein
MLKKLFGDTDFGLAENWQPLACCVVAQVGLLD